MNCASCDTPLGRTATWKIRNAGASGLCSRCFLAQPPSLRNARRKFKVRAVDVPANVERVRESSPCFRCGTRAGVSCKHRPHGEESRATGFSVVGCAAGMMVGS